LSFEAPKIYDKDAFFEDAEKIYHRAERGDLVEPMKKAIPLDTLYFYWVNSTWK